MTRHELRRFFAATSVALAVLLLGAPAGAVTFSYNLSLDGIDSTEYRTRASYHYTLTQNPGSSTLSYIDFEIPVEIAIPAGTYSGGGAGNGTFSFMVTANGQATSGEVYDVGVGDYGTKFGVGDTRYRVLKANVPNAGSHVAVVLTLRGQFDAGRQFGDVGLSESGVVLIKAGNGANTQAFVVKTPTVVNTPPAPRPVFSSLTVFPNPVVLPDCTTVNWVVSDLLAVVQVSPTDNVTVAGSQATICPGAAGTYSYTITATGAGGSTTESFSITAVDAPPPPLVFSLSVLPNPVTPPGCATISWDVAGATVTINPSGAATVYDQHATICFDESVAAGVHTFTITATVPGGSSSTVTFSITTNEPPLIETSCKQIVKTTHGRKTCTYLCLKTVNGLQDIDSATWYDNGDCDPTVSPGFPLKVYGPKSPQKTIVCAPCRTDVSFPHPEVCPENVGIESGVMPFRLDLTGVDPDTSAVVPYSLYCDFLTRVVQDQDLAAALGDDGYIWVNGKQIRTSP